MEMEGAMEAAATVDSASLSWQDVQQICGEMEKMFQADAAKDADRLRALIDKRKAIAAAAQARQATASRQLQHLLSNLREWEEKESATKAREEQLLMRLQELEAVKREMNVQLERFRLDEQSSKQSLEQLLDKYEDARQKLVEYTMAHQNEVPAAKHQMSLYASVTGIKWDLTGQHITGDIHVPAKQTIVRFEVDPAADQFEAANALWDKIDLAFDDIDSDL